MKPRQSGRATDFPAVETHPDENVSIAADPYNTPEKCSIFRVDYLKYDYMPIRLIVTNNGDKPISLVDARIHLITRDGDKIPAAKPGDIVRATTFDSKAGRTIPLPAPLPPIRGKAKTSTKNIEADFATLRIRRAGSRAAHHACRIPVLRRERITRPAEGRPSLPAHAPQRRRKRSVLFRNPAG